MENAVIGVSSGWGRNDTLSIAVRRGRPDLLEADERGDGAVADHPVETATSFGDGPARRVALGAGRSKVAFACLAAIAAQDGQADAPEGVPRRGGISAYSTRPVSGCPGTVANAAGPSRTPSR